MFGAGLRYCVVHRANRRVFIDSVKRWKGRRVAGGEKQAGPDFTWRARRRTRVTAWKAAMARLLATTGFMTVPTVKGRRYLVDDLHQKQRCEPLKAPAGTGTPPEARNIRQVDRQQNVARGGAGP